jgi:hypothetical protein
VFYLGLCFAVLFTAFSPAQSFAGTLVRDEQNSKTITTTLVHAHVA